MSNLGNTYDGTLLVSASRTATTSSERQVNVGGNGVVVTVDVTTLGSSSTLTPTIEYWDPASTKWVALNASPTAISATGTKAYVVYPSGASTNAGTDVAQVVSLPLPMNWRVTVTHNNSNACVYSVGYVVIGS